MLWLSKLLGACSFADSSMASLQHDERRRDLVSVFAIGIKNALVGHVQLSFKLSIPSSSIYSINNYFDACSRLY